MRGLRVLRLTPFFYHATSESWPAQYDPVGGQQTQCYLQSLWLAERGVEQLVLTLGFPGLPDEYYAHPLVKVKRARYSFPEWRSRTSGLVGLTKNWWLAVRHSCQRLRADRSWRPDLVHIHADGQIDTLRLVPWAGKLFECPVVLTVHCSRLSNYRPMNWLDHLWHSRVQQAERLALQAANAIICLSERTREVLHVAARDAADRIHLIPDCVDVNELRAAAHGEAASLTCKGLGLVDRRPLIAFIGRIAPEKGWRDVVRFMKTTPASGWHVIFVGDGPERKRLTRTIAAAELCRHALITGFVSRSAVAAILAAADCVIMPSVHEEFGGVAIEALALGIPVVGYAVGGLATTLRMIDSRLAVPPGDVEALVRMAGAAIAEQPSLLETVQRAPEIIRQRFGIDQVMPMVHALYQKLVGVPPPQACPESHE